MGVLNICVWVEHYSVTFMMADMLHIAIKIEWHDNNIIATTGACK